MTSTSSICGAPSPIVDPTSFERCLASHEPFPSLLGATCGAVRLGFNRVRRAEPVFQLVAAFNFVPIRANGGEWWPDLVTGDARHRMNRFRPFLGLHGAVRLGFNRVRRAEPMAVEFA